MNAKNELLKVLKPSDKIVCASLCYWPGEYKHLKIGYSEEEYQEFLEYLDYAFEARDLYGTIWLEDSKWLTIDRTDGKECWVHIERPKIPEECL
jgi:hypothetical protein